MKYKIIVTALLCMLVMESGGISATTQECCYGYMEGSTCKCYAQSGSCSHCSISTTGCTDCNSTDWDSTGTDGYEYKINAMCSVINNKCSKTVLYRCAAGFYGTTTNGTSGCRGCPYADMWDDSRLVTRSARNSVAGSSPEEANCFVPGGTSKKFYDVAGTFQLSQDCYF